MENGNTNCDVLGQVVAESLPLPSLLLYNLEKDGPCEAGKFQGLPGIGELFPF